MYAPYLLIKNGRGPVKHKQIEGIHVKFYLFPLFKYTLQLVNENVKPKLLTLI